ncbi:hypothetical protein [Paenibacillus guangzhouensis]|uniref:hypothetical protein n=1 Tax=Paenibacillus guangzhouensis TaxID=1473112 RepID=UPI0012675C10|nr:hypothetical protein [Paenibacillus guangzhouensis]
MSKQSDLSKVLNSLTKEQLIDIIEQVAQGDQIIANKLIVKYGEVQSGQEIMLCKKLIKSIVARCKGREGFIHYRETYGFVQEMMDVLEKIHITSDVLLALDIAFLVLGEAVEAFQYADDSNGEIGFLVQEVLKQVRRMVLERETEDNRVNTAMFDRILVQSDSEIFKGWEDFRIELLGICAEFTDNVVLRERLQVKLRHVITEKSDDDYMEYTQEQLLQLLFMLVTDYGTEEEKDQFIQEHIHFTFFRERAIDQYLVQHNYDKVIELALVGEEQDKQFAGLVHRWKKSRYLAYHKLSFRKEQWALAEEMLLDGDFEYYHELKLLADKDQPHYYQEIKEKLKKTPGWRSKEIYLKVIELEEDIEEMMDVVRHDPSSIEHYADRLIDSHKDEVILIYGNHIENAARQSNNRKAYQQVCKIIKRYKAIAGKDRYDELVMKLKELHGNRPAFLDELSKLK